MKKKKGVTLDVPVSTTKIRIQILEERKDLEERAKRGAHTNLHSNALQFYRALVP
jgi:hypothetical protein